MRDSTPPASLPFPSALPAFLKKHPKTQEKTATRPPAASPQPPPSRLPSPQPPPSLPPAKAQAALGVVLELLPRLRGPEPQLPRLLRGGPGAHRLQAPRPLLRVLARRPEAMGGEARGEAWSQRGEVEVRWRWRVLEGIGVGVGGYWRLGVGVGVRGWNLGLEVWGWLQKLFRGTWGRISRSQPFKDQLFKALSNVAQNPSGLLDVSLDILTNG